MAEKRLHNAFGPLPAATGAGLQFIETTLTSSQILNLVTIRQVLIPAPPAGKMIYPVMLVMEYIFGGTAYGSTGTFTFSYGSDTRAVFASQNGAGFLNQVSSQFGFAPPVSSTSTAYIPKSIADGAALEVFNSAAAFLTGNGSVVFRIAYIIANST